MSDEITEKDLDAMVEQGLMEVVGVDPDGSKRYRLTALGEARAESFIAETVEGADLWARLENRDRD